MLSVADKTLSDLNPDAQLEMFGQELNDESYAICNSDMLIKGHNPDRIVNGNSFTEDGFPNKTFDYMLSNPPFGVSWRKVKDEVEREHEEQGWDGRFGAGTPRVNDGSMLFLQHMLSKRKPPEEGGSRIAIVFNGSPLFNGGPSSGESAIRRWIIENDWLEAIIGLPENLFYNTGIHTFIWIISNDKSEERQGKVQLINARQLYREMEENLGDKRYELSNDHIDEIVELYNKLEDTESSKIVENEEFGYRRITIDQPLRMSFKATEERIKSLHEERAFTNRDEETQEAVKEALRSLDSEKQWMNREVFMDNVELAFNMNGVDVRNSVFNAIERALGERNPEAEIITVGKGNPKHDIDLRSRERVPLNQDVKDFFKEEVEPFSENVWINESQNYHDDKDRDLGNVGYEINFRYYFEDYEPVRSVDEIDEDIFEFKDEVVKMLQEVTQ